MIIDLQGQPVDPYAPLGFCSQCGAAAWATTRAGLLCPSHESVLIEAEERGHIYQVGEWVVINSTGRLAQVEEQMPCYPDQKWYWLRLRTPRGPETLGVSEFPHNATHECMTEAELSPADGDDFAEPPTVGSEVI